MSKKKIFTLNQAKTIGEQLGISWDHLDLVEGIFGGQVEASGLQLCSGSDKEESFGNWRC